MIGNVSEWTQDWRGAFARAHQGSRTPAARPLIRAAVLCGPVSIRLHVGFRCVVRET
jgi:formylglycine-generating enzyme required for sulfatase activity